MQRVADIRAELETLPDQNTAMKVRAEGSEKVLWRIEAQQCVRERQL